MRAISDIPTPECKVQLYLTLQDIDKLQNLRKSMITHTGGKDYLDSNTAYCLITAILSALGVNNERD
jgi:hypothetical protein